MSDIEGKGARVAPNERGQRVSFNDEVMTKPEITRNKLNTMISMFRNWVIRISSFFVATGLWPV
jgi:hypothetical protein